MRTDMAKVVTERPRRGHANKSKKTRAKVRPIEFEADDHGPTYAPVSRKRTYGYMAKEFSDLINPLRKYLRKQVGRPWNDVYSELSQTLDKRSMAGLHIWQHVDSEVSRYVTWVDGKLSDLEFTGRHYRQHDPDGLYIHPDTGILCWADSPKRQKYVDPNAKNKRKLTDTDSIEKIDGIWYWLRTEQVPDTERIYDHKTMTWYSRPIVRTKIIKKQLNTKELEKAGLKNGV